MIGATLFSGIGAPEQAMPSWRWAWAGEIEPFPSAVLAARHPASVNLGDVSAPDFAERAGAIARPDVLVFGSPCQSFSVAGRRLGLADPRGNLALVALGVVDALRPRWFVFENVPGLLSSDHGRDFGALLGIVGELGYGWAYRVFDARHFGVPQRRRRVFVVGRLGDWRGAAAVLFEPESLRRHPAPGGEAGPQTAGSLEAGVGGDRVPGDNPIAFGGNNTAGPIDVAAALNAKGGPGRMDFETETLVAFTSKDHGQDAGGLAPTLRAMSGRRANGGGQVAVAWNVIGSGQQGRNHAYEATVSGCLQHKGLAASGNEAGTLAQTTAGVRRLMPVECERLQGFPDGYTDVRFRGRPAADGSRYKALGNSMAVPVMRWILGRVEFADAAACGEAA